MVSKLIMLQFVVATVISITTTIPVSYARNLQSTFTATGRRHACPGEPVTYICHVDGQYIRWNFNSNYRATLYHDHDVNTVRMVSGQHGIRAILIGNDELPGNQQAHSRRLTSILIIEQRDILRGEFHNISCSSDTDVQTHAYHIAEIPNKPLNVHLEAVSPTQLQQSKNIAEFSQVKVRPHTLSVKWDLPDNVQRFDLEKFIVHASIQDVDNDVWYNSSNGTDAHFGHHLVVPPRCEVHVTVTAVSKCSQQGLMSDVTEWRDSLSIIDIEKLKMYLSTDTTATVDHVGSGRTFQHTNSFKKSYSSPVVLDMLVAGAFVLPRHLI